MLHLIKLRLEALTISNKADRVAYIEMGIYNLHSDMKINDKQFYRALNNLIK